MKECSIDSRSFPSVGPSTSGLFCHSNCYQHDCTSCLATLPQGPVIPQDTVTSSIYISVISQEKNDKFYAPVPLRKAGPQLGLRKCGRKFAPVPKHKDMKACKERQGKYSHIVAVSRDEPVAIKWTGLTKQNL